MVQHYKTNTQRERRRDIEREIRQTDVKSKQIKSENTKDTIRERVPCGRVATLIRHRTRLKLRLAYLYDISVLVH